MSIQRLLCWLIGHNWYQFVSYKTAPPTAFPARCLRCNTIQKAGDAQ